MHLTEEDRLRLVAVAVDVQGAQAARPWLERAGVTFPAAVDDADVLATAFGLVAVPVALCLGEDRRLAAPPARVRVDDETTRVALVAWGRGETPAPALPAENVSYADDMASGARAWLRLARLALQDGRGDDAAAALDRAWECDPGSWLVRKQRWALREPERFYAGEIDLEWQASQIATGR